MVNTAEIAPPPASQVEPPFEAAPSRDLEIRQLLTAMGRRSRPAVFYTTLPACNAEA